MNRLIYLSGLVCTLSLFIWTMGYILFMLVIFSLSAPMLPPKADAAVILTGGSKRVQSGFELLQRGIVPKIFISGVHPDVKLDELLAQYDQNLTPAQKAQIHLGKEALDTEGNAQEAIDWTKQQNINHVILVTATYHMPRALYEFQARSPDLKISPASVTPPKYSPQFRHFWWLGLKEYNKLLVRWTRNTLQLKAG